MSQNAGTPRETEPGGDAAGMEVYTCARVTAYRELARTLTRPEDTVIEVGCAEGHTTGYLANRAARVIAVDKTNQCMERARERCRAQKNITWLQADAFEPGHIQKQVERADLVFIDIGGSTQPWLALRLASMYRLMFRPRALVIRNVDLNDFAAAVAGCEEDADPGHWRDPGLEE